MSRAFVLLLRVGLPVILLLAGLVILATADGGTRWDGWAMCWGSAMALVLVTFLIRMGNAGESERLDEERARAFYSEHGHWPDEEPRG